LRFVPIARIIPARIVPIATMSICGGFVPLMMFVPVVVFMSGFIIVVITAVRAGTTGYLVQLILAQLLHEDILRIFCAFRKHGRFPFHS
jgi:hypothetical protein